MFDIQIRLLVNGRPAGIQEFVDGFIREVAHSVRSEIPRLESAREMRPVEPPAEVRGAQKTKPLAVGINEAAELIGLSPWTIRGCVKSGKIRAIHVGRRVLVPMQALEKVMVEGVRGRTLK